MMIARRELLMKLGAAIAIAPLARLATACGESTSDVSDAGDDALADAITSTDVTVDAANVAWATGGTASMTAKASYPNPFASGAPSTCTLMAQLTEGPCYDSASEVLQDISYGQDGLPMQMVLQIIDASCNPVVGAVVDVWHVAPTGKYSGDDTANEQVAFCTGNDSDYTSHLYFRGKQTTDANGIVTFDTCFPGWYSSRTIHVHATITSGGASLTTQLVFDDSLDNEIVASQPIYDTRGSRDTTNLTDTVVSASTYTAYLFDTQKMTDGAMLAWKTIAIS